MKRNDDQIKKRAALIQLAINSPDKAALYLEQLAFSLRCCKGTQQTIQVLKDVLFLSEPTIYKDLTIKTDLKLIKE